jgi:cytoskeletal protein CcmA (bactofilin family)
MRELSSPDLGWNDDATSAFEPASVVDRHSTFDGTFRSQRDLRVEGDLKGNVSCDGTMFIAEGASVSASVDAEHITVAGQLRGEVRCRGRLHILPTGRVQAKVATATLVIQDGALYEGQLEMAGIDVSTPKPLRARAAGPVSLEAAAADRQSGGNTTFIRRLGSPEAPWEAPPADDDQPDTEDESEADGPAG